MWALALGATEARRWKSGTAVFLERARCLQGIFRVTDVSGLVTHNAIAFVVLLAFLFEHRLHGTVWPRETGWLLRWLLGPVHLS